MKKAIVIGSPGAGKTTFARKLAAKTGLPLYHLDTVWHNPDKTTISRDEFDKALSEILANDSYIIDGHYTRTLETRIKDCDTIFFLDFPLDACIDGIHERVGKPRPEMPWIEEEVDPEFLQYVKDFHQNSIDTLRETLEKYTDTKQIYVFKSRLEADKYIDCLRKGENMKILMIGNSAIYYHDIPKTLESLIKENGYEVQIDSVTKGGRKLYENLNPDDENGKTINSLCQANRYDILFLQEQTVLPLSDIELFRDSAKKLQNIVKADRTVLYATPPRKEGAKYLVESGKTVYEMAKGITDAYYDVASSMNAEVSPVSMCVYNVMKAHPEIELHAEDRAHFSYTGSCVAALAHYKAIFGKLPKKHETVKLDKETINIFKEIIDQTF